MAETKAPAAAPSDDGKNFFVAAPAVSLPKGGGAIRGMGEKFAANPVTGTGSISVPIATSPSRGGFCPQLALAYDSGAGNGPFGFGWSLSLPSITRKTDKGLPRYDDASESDVFILSGAEELVPVYRQDAAGNWVLDAQGKMVIHEDDRTIDGVPYKVRRYRPRIEGLFARIERWTNVATGEMHWRSISRDNITTFYGKDNNSRIFDPANPNPAHPTRIFSWLICESYDDKGNAIVYEYAAENDAGVDRTQANERNRIRTANRYLKRIKYGNRVSRLVQPDLSRAAWMFEVVFDYDEGHVFNEMTDADQRTFVEASVTSTQDWTRRQDPLSSYRAGFEVRTYRLCQRVLMLHHFPGEPGVGADCLVRSTDFTYSYEQNPDNASNPIYSFLRSVTQSGYKRANNGYMKRSLPPVEFEYTQPIVQGTVEEVDAASLENLPIGLDGAAYQWTDLHGEGIPGILTEQAGAWFYKRNLSPINMRPGSGTAHREAKFAAVELVGLKPNLALSGGAQIMDLAGDGQPDLVVTDGPVTGLSEHDGKEGWLPFRPFTSRLNRDMRDPNLKFVDLNGDGHADVLITEDDAFVWHPSLAEEGFGPALRVAQAMDEEKGPRLVFADGTESIYLADLSGDGLTDLARIRNGEVCYWPNLGYGRFGAKVTMDNAPWFDHTDQFEQKRIRLADIDGSGTTDIIYLHRDGVRLYFNQSGNGWGAPQPLPVALRIDDLVATTVIDLLGSGTACLVWSSPLPWDARRHMRYVNLMGDQKPHLLIKTRNNLGAETKVQYAPSTKFYLQDKYADKPWITRLPFPVHVVEGVETYDHISRNRFVTTYTYHHGYFDGEEREFRGFGMVEQKDTEEFAALSGDGRLPEATNVDSASHVPPILTKTWFHTGTYLGRGHVSDFFAGLLDDHDRGEYYREPAWRDDDVEAKRRLLPDTVLPDGLSIDEEREACRALKGAMLRLEVYALDGRARAEHPYTIAEQNFTIQRLQPRAGNPYAVFFTHPREAITYHYERNPADPRISHALTLEVDEFGDVLKSVAVGYGRRRGQSPLLGDDKKKQEQVLITYTENDVTNPIDDGVHYPDDYRAPLPCETRTYEVTGFELMGGDVRFGFNLFADNHCQALVALTEIDYSQPTDYTKKQKRLIECVRTLYRPDDCGAARNDPLALLPLCELQPLALPGESYRLAFTPGLLTQVFQRNGQPLLPGPANVLGGQDADRGGYTDLDGNGQWWIPSGRVFLSPDGNDTAAQELDYARINFFLPHRYRDPFYTNAVSTESLVTYDTYNLLMVETRDALGNVVTVKTEDDQHNVAIRNDYRVLQPDWVTDPNRNRIRVVFDALGLVVVMAVMGKPPTRGRAAEGDELDTFTDGDADPTLVTLQNFVNDPRGQAQGLLKGATTRIIYDLDRFTRCGQPPFAATLARETHVSDLSAGAQSKIQLSFLYSDGFGREIQSKIQAEAGDAPQRDAALSTASGDTQPGGLQRDVAGTIVLANTAPRWVGTGRTVFNNKGKPIKKYEPFFSSTHLYELEPDMTDTGVTPILFYDPAERVVATLHPNHTYDKVVFDPWQQTTWDVNDTVMIDDPKADQDVGSFFDRLPDFAYLPTWHAQYLASVNPAERIAARRTEAHANTPTVAHFDTLGRTFLTIADNGLDANGNPQLYQTRAVLDIEGNQREVVDAKDRVVMRYDYDMLGSRIHQASMEASERWTFGDVLGKPIRAWDSRGFLRRMTYDPLRRPTGLLVTENGVERLAEQTVYGESQGDANNHKTRVYQVFDGAGVVTSEKYDFKGNLRHSKRELLPDYQQAVDWLQNPAPNDGTFTSSTEYDALNRPTAVTAPDSSVYRPTFNEANLLDKVDVNLRGAGTAASFVTNIDYNAHGQRTFIQFANDAATTYEYDDRTFRLIHLKTTRRAGQNGLASQLFADTTIVQDLHYTYDPVGNITSIADDAIPAIQFNNENVEPDADYSYDAIYRLIVAHGREHISHSGFDFNPPNDNYRDYPFYGLHANPNDPQAVRNYTEAYDYDEVGNIKSVRHSAKNGDWTRAHAYSESSLLEAGKKNNRLTRTDIGNVPETYTYTDAQGNDVHGCVTAINSMTMVWDFEDQLQQVDLGGGGTAYYVYDAAGQRVRKVIHNQNGAKQKERLYLGGFEIYREYNGAGGATPKLERETLHIMDDKQRIALVETKTKDTGVSAKTLPQTLTRYQFTNHLGSASLELDNAGAVISYEEYHPYGTSSFQAVRSQTETPKRYRYTGKERDEESGLYYHGARYYAPWMGRWMSCDPALFVDGTNLYAYVKMNPLRFADLSGLGAGEQSLGAQMEKASKRHQDLANDLRAQAGLKPVEVERQQGVGGKRKTIPDEVKQTPAATAPNTVVDTKARHVDAERNMSATKRRADIEENLEQVKYQVKELAAAGEAAPDANGKVLRVIHDNDLGKSSTEALPEWQQEAKEVRAQWVEDATDPAEKALRERVDVVTTTRDRFSKATKAIEEKLGTLVESKAIKVVKEAGIKIAKSKAAKVVLAVAPILASGLAKAAPIVGTVVGAYGVTSELEEGDVRGGMLDLVGMSEIPVVSQTADIGRAVEDAGWVAKDIIDPEQKAEQWAHENLSSFGF